MKKDDVVILTVTFLAGIMVIVFTIVFVFIGNHKGTFASGNKDNAEAFSGAQNTTEIQQDDMSNGTPAESGLTDESETHAERDLGTVGEFIDDGQMEDDNRFGEIENKMISESEVDLIVEDTAIHDVEYEDTYVNTIPLLPSTRGEREQVPRDRVSTQNFMRSSIGEEKCVITITTVDETGNEGQVTISVPTEVFLYNVENAASNTCEIKAEMEGDVSMLHSVGWTCEDASELSLSKTSGDTTIVQKKKDMTGDTGVDMLVSYYDVDHVSRTEEFTVTVHVSDMQDNSIRLYDRKGIALYKDPDGTQPAYLSDYAEQESFYGVEKITGWQTMDGNTYYFTASGWPVTGMQIIGGARYTFDQNGVLISGVGQRGIDVSRYQQNIDWEQVAADGVDFAIIRCGFRGSTNGKLVEDSYFRQNIDGATKAGVKVGVYFFSQAITEKEAEEEAMAALALTRGYHMDLPIFIDSENAVNGRANGLDRDTRTRVLQAFCETVTREGGMAGVYASKNWYYNKVYASRLEQYTIWVAQYSPVCDYTGKMDYWQYSSRESVQGIVGNVDMNLVYINTK